MITRELSILCDHGVARASCKECTPIAPIARVGDDRTLPIVTGVLTVGRGCRWLGKAVLHHKDDCECQNIPDSYVQITKDGAVYTAHLAAIIRDVRTRTMPSSKRHRVKIVDVETKYLFQCRECWPKRRHFKTEGAAVSHLEGLHGIIVEACIAEVIKDVTGK